MSQWVLAGGALLAVGGAIAALLVWLGDPNGYPRRALDRYDSLLERELRFLLSDRTAASISRPQIACMCAGAVFAVVLGSAEAWGFVAIAAVGPIVYFRVERNKRVKKLESQIDGWLLLLANSLKATPSIGEALASSIAIVHDPMRAEVDICVKQVRLGTPIDVALVNMSRRLGSRPLSAALGSILVSRQTGGDLPRLLETMAETYRELARLEALLRAQTSKDRVQLIVLALAPPGAVLMLEETGLGAGEVLFHTFAGGAMLAVATIIWGSALVLARRILAVSM